MAAGPPEDDGSAGGCIRHALHPQHPLQPLPDAQHAVCNVCRCSGEGRIGCQLCGFVLCSPCAAATEGNELNGAYSGPLVRGAPHGFGTLRCAHGTYEGMFKSGRFVEGALICRGGATHKGTWRNFEKAGHGTECSGGSSRAEMYRGWFDGGMRSGHGSATWGSLARYTGDWKAGRPHGVGVYRFAPKQAEAEPATSVTTREVHQDDGLVLQAPQPLRRCWGCGAASLPPSRRFLCNTCSCELCMACFEAGVHEEHTFTSVALLAEKYPWGGSYQGRFLHGRMHGEGTLRGADGKVLAVGRWEKGVFCSPADGCSLPAAAPAGSSLSSPSNSAENRSFSDAPEDYFYELA